MEAGYHYRPFPADGAEVSIPDGGLDEQAQVGGEWSEARKSIRLHDIADDPVVRGAGWIATGPSSRLTVCISSSRDSRSRPEVEARIGIETPCSHPREC